MTAKKCIMPKLNGDPCGSYQQGGTEYCIAHDPDKKESQLAASRRGGKQTRYRGERLADVKALIFEAQKMTGIVVTPDDRTIKLVTLEDTVDFSRVQLQRFVDRANNNFELSNADEVLLFKWTEFVLKLQIAMGLGANERIMELEDAAYNEQLRLGRGNG